MPAVLPLEGLLAGDEPPDAVPDVAPVDDVPLVEPVGGEAPLAPLVVDPVDDPELAPPQAASVAANAKAKGDRMACRDLRDKFAPGFSWTAVQVSAKR